MPSHDNWTGGTVSSGPIHRHQDNPVPAMSAKQHHPHHQSGPHPGQTTHPPGHISAKRRASSTLTASTASAASSGAANGSSSGQNPGSGSNSGASGPGSGTGNGQSSGSGTSSKKVSHVPCKFYRQSMCQAGDKCPFSHDLDTERPAVCKYFEKGNCKFGSKCALAHIGADGRQINKRSPKSARDGLKSPRSAATRDKKPEPDTEKRSLASFTPRLTQEPADFEPGASSHLNPTQTYAQAVQSPITHEKRVTLNPPTQLNQTQLNQNQLNQSQLSQGQNQTQIQGHNQSQNQSQSQIQNQNQNQNQNQPLASPLEPSRLASRGSFSQQSRLGSIFDFGAQNGPASGRSNSMSLPGTTSIWQDRSAFARRVEGSAIADDDDSDVLVETDEGFEEGLVPSTLSDLLTPQERDRRNSRNSRESRGSFGSLGIASPAQPPPPPLASAQFSPKSRSLSSPIQAHAPLAQVPTPVPSGLHQAVPNGSGDPWTWYQRPPPVQTAIPPQPAQPQVGRSPIGYPFTTPVRPRTSRPSGTLVGSPPSLYGFGLAMPQPGVQQPIPTPPSSAPRAGGPEFKLGHEQPTAATTTAENAF